MTTPMDLWATIYAQYSEFLPDDQLLSNLGRINPQVLTLARARLLGDQAIDLALVAKHRAPGWEPCLYAGVHHP